MFEIGNSLREARERQGLELAQLEADTKVRAKYLRALEEERFDVLPAESYARGFLDVYATRLGLDSQLYVDEFDSRFAQGERAEAGVRRVATDRRLRLEASAVAIGLVGILAVTVLVIAAWQFSGGGGEDPAPAEPVAQPAPAQAPPSAPPPAASAPASPAVAPPVQEAAAPEPVDAVLEVRSLASDTRVTVRRNGRNGRVIFAGTLSRGETQAFEGPRLHAAFRNPKRTEVSVNGETLPTTPRRLVVTADGWQSG